MKPRPLRSTVPNLRPLWPALLVVLAVAGCAANQGAPDATEPPSTGAATPPVAATAPAKERLDVPVE
jgi:hypothetical protein